MATPRVFVITGPSGVGKGTLNSNLMKRVPNLELSISATTRKPRVATAKTDNNTPEGSETTSASARKKVAD